MKEDLIFRPLKKLPKEKPFVVWDVETQPAYPGEPINTKWLGAGIYDGDSEPQIFTDEQTFFRTLLGPAYVDHWVYAHNGSGFDFHYLMRYLCAQKAEIVGFKTGQRTFLTAGGRDFYDSMAILKGSLASVGESLGLKFRKWDVKADPHFYEEIVHRPWREYLADDLRSLYEAIDITRTSWREMGAVLRPTLASTAMCLFRAQFLEYSIRCPQAWAPQPELWRSAYLGGRSECFNPKMGEGASWDVNSSYPFSMIDPAGIPCDYAGEYKVNRLPETPCLAEATVDVPYDERHPPLGMKGKDGRLYFPTGKRSGWFTSIELNYCREKYGSEAVKIHRVHLFKCLPIFDTYIAAMYKLKKKAVKGPLYEASKGAMNSLYGKFGMRRDREKIVSGPKWHDWPWNDPDALRGFEDRGEVPGKRVISLEDNLYAIPEQANYAPYVMPQIAATVTARSRILLQHLLDKAGSSSVYCDTDSVYAEQPADFFPSTKELGGLKLESEISEGLFPAPKVYWIREKNGKTKGRAKGIRYKDADAVLRFINGETIEIKRMLGLYEVCRRNGNHDPMSELQEKRSQVLSTRRHPDGRAYSISEMKALGFLDGSGASLEKFQNARAAYLHIVPEEMRRDFWSSDAKFFEWKRSGKNRPQPYHGPELEAFEQHLEPNRKFSSMAEAFCACIGRARTYMDDRVKTAISLVRETIGEFLLPDDVQQLYINEKIEEEYEQNNRNFS